MDNFLPSQAERLQDFKNDVNSGKCNLAGAVFGLFLIGCLVLGAKVVADKSYGEPIVVTSTQTK